MYIINLLNQPLTRKNSSRLRFMDFGDSFDLKIKYRYLHKLIYYSSLHFVCKCITYLLNVGMLYQIWMNPCGICRLMLFDILIVKSGNKRDSSPENRSGAPKGRRGRKRPCWALYRPHPVPLLGQERGLLPYRIK